MYPSPELNLRADGLSTKPNQLSNIILIFRLISVRDHWFIGWCDKVDSADSNRCSLLLSWTGKPEETQAAFCVPTGLRLHRGGRCFTRWMCVHWFWIQSYRGNFLSFLPRRLTLDICIVFWCMWAALLFKGTRRMQFTVFILGDLSFKFCSFPPRFYLGKHCPVWSML